MRKETPLRIVWEKKTVCEWTSAIHICFSNVLARERSERWILYLRLTNIIHFLRNSGSCICFFQRILAASLLHLDTIRPFLYLRCCFPRAPGVWSFVPCMTCARDPVVPLVTFFTKQLAGFLIALMRGVRRTLVARTIVERVFLLGRRTEVDVLRLVVELDPLVLRLTGRIITVHG